MEITIDSLETVKSIQILKTNVFQQYIPANTGQGTKLVHIGNALDARKLQLSAHLSESGEPEVVQIGNVKLQIPSNL